MISTVRQILEGKEDKRVWTISPKDTVIEALRRMADRNIGALLVVEEDHIVGIISERDYARKIILKNRSSETTLVEEIMTPAVIYVEPDEKVEACMALVTEKRIRHLPVIENKKLVGLISVGDVVKAFASDQQFVIDQLIHYVTDTYTSNFKS